MIKKEKEKKLAIRLRKKGLSYNEILKKVPAAKSTLSVWLQNIGIGKKQKQRLTLKRKLAQLKAQAACRKIRTDKEKAIITAAKKEVGTISRKNLWLIGTILYWAEGTKQKKNNVSQRVSFVNSDPKMVILFDKWLREICSWKKENLIYTLYIHRTANKEKDRKFWENLLKINIKKIYFKTHTPRTNRENINKNYHGLLRIDARRSTDLNRKIQGWILGINENLKIHIAR